MANPTTNFGWVMPTSSSLVTNLPADFNTFGQGVDTSLAQLKGGTTGQILSKTSATDMAFTWITNDVGDITAVTAGTGISGGGTSGAVTITNSMATEITAKGDLIAGTGSATFDNLPVGTNGQTLVADSSTATGLKWATPSSGSTFSGCRLLKTSGNQAIADSTFVAVTWNSEDFDVNAYHSTVTNTSRITIPTGYGGYYRFSWQEYVLGSASIMYLYKNGARVTYDSVASDATACFTTVVAGAVGDYFEVYLRQTSGTSKTIADENNGAQGIVWFDCNYVGA